MIERVIATWENQPYTAVDKRYITVRHRVKVAFYPDVGADIRHEIRCEERNTGDWSLAEKWEFRSHGCDKLKTELGEGLP
ncbi:hypothetical protein [Halovenus marina]|uniref:hypothetical protein n=1 Tax=Halovenus marina TaxID=3396621 RepID=UPI003F545454